MGTNNTAMITLSDTFAPEFPGAKVEKCISQYGRLAGQVTGFKVEFPNGMTFSCQWHDGAYSNVGRGYWKPEEGEQPDFETAAWYPQEYAKEGEFGPETPWYDPQTDAPHSHDAPGGSCDQVQAYQSVDEVMETARKVAAHRLPTLPDGEVDPHLFEGF